MWISVACAGDAVEGEAHPGRRLAQHAGAAHQLEHTAEGLPEPDEMAQAERRQSNPGALLVGGTPRNYSYGVLHCLPSVISAFKSRLLTNLRLILPSQRRRNLGGRL